MGRNEGEEGERAKRERGRKRNDMLPLERKERKEKLVSLFRKLSAFPLLRLCDPGSDRAHTGEQRQRGHSEKESSSRALSPFHLSSSADDEKEKKTLSHLEERTALSSGPDGLADDVAAPLLPRPTISGDDVGASTAGLPDEEATALALAPRERASGEEEEEEAADADAMTTALRAARPRGGACSPEHSVRLTQRMLTL